MGVRISPKAASAAFKAVADKSGKLAYQVAEELGISVNKATHADAELIDSTVKALGNAAPEEADAVFASVKAYLKNQDNPGYTPGSAASASRAPAEVKAALDAPTARPASAPPNVDDAMRVDFPSGPEAAAGKGKGFSVRDPNAQKALPAADQGVPVGAPRDPAGTPPSFHATEYSGMDPKTGRPIRADLENPPSTNVRAIDAEYIEPGPGTALALRGQPVVGEPPPSRAQLALPRSTASDIVKDPKAARTAAAVVGAAGVGAGLNALQDDDPTKTAPGAAQADEGDIVPDAGMQHKETKAPAPNPSDPNYIVELPKLAMGTYDGPAAPKPLGPEEEFIEVRGEDGKPVRVRPTDLVAKAQAELIDATNKLAAEYRAERDQQKQAALWEGIVQSVGLIAAGAYGMRNGVDMSGVKFSPTDWVAQQEALRRQYDTLQGFEDKKHAAKLKTADAASGDLKDRNAARERNWAREMDIHKAALQEFDRREDRKFRDWQTQVQGINLKNQVIRWDHEDDLAEKRIHAQLLRASDSAERAAQLAELKQLGEDRKDRRKLGTLLQRAAAAKDKEAGAVFVAQAQEINDSLAERGRGIPDTVFTDPKGGNRWLFHSGPDVPAPRDPDDAAKAYAKYAAEAKPGTAPAAAPTKTVSQAKLADYARAYKMTPAEATTYLKSQGYSIVP